MAIERRFVLSIVSLSSTECLAMRTMGLEIVATGVTLMAMALSAAAEPADDRENPPRRGATATTAAAPSSDELLGGCLAIGNQEEVALAEFARGHAQSDEVKQFAEMMITDHTEFLSKLQPFAPELAREGLLRIDAREARPRSGERRPGGAANDDAPPADVDAQAAGEQPQRPPRGEARGEPPQPGQAIDFVQLRIELAQECLQTAVQELSGKPGTEFDKCYMTAQVLAHEKMLVTLRVFQRHASPELAQVIAEGEKSASRHLEHARRLAQQAEESYFRTAARPEAPERTEP
jgi:predicted outer membrane protein